MGPLMDVKHPDCLKLRKNNWQWSNYIAISTGQPVGFIQLTPDEAEQLRIR